ncbi:FAD-dependent oxidoreductase [Bacillus sp. FJAT-42376]|uniref:dihydrolipoyl dehydrogenase family protein n=1 Tax=Bacillus sp. FJAT-42376 TaxID=2014076 RepID=UPI000F50F401|nr:FAD-dependent oxidoreductase [Bacillus sp. FJAT-42376]AZB41446.1 FAD-dependent oxidoreductase [Bacillus sp. FJAT-42376]
MVVGELAQEREVVIIGGGPGGYTAAIRAAQLGLEVTLIEKGNLGGVCLNQGCIPSKVFANVSSKFSGLQKLGSMGIGTSGIALDLAQTAEYSRQVTAGLRKGVEALCRQAKVEIVPGKAAFLSDDRIGVENGDDFQVFTFKQAIIAAGCSPLPHPAIAPDHQHVLDSRSLYALDQLPEHLMVYGNDYMAVEAAFSYRHLGCEVTLIHEDGLAGLDASIEKELLRVMKKAKIKWKQGMVLENLEKQDDRLHVFFKGEDGSAFELEGSHLYIQTEYRGNAADLGLARLGVKTDGSGFIEIDRECRTSAAGIWAAGDITGGKRLAVQAISQGKAAAASIAGLPAEWNEGFPPLVIRSQPPVACAGLTEAEARNQGYRVKTGQFSFAGNGFASLTGQKDGIAKVISDAENEVILGIHLMGDGAPELISTGITALEMAAREEDLTFPLYPHPSMNEGLLEAMEDLQGMAIHKPPARIVSHQK